MSWTVILLVQDKIATIYTVSGKNGPPKHVKITLCIENVSEYFSLYYEKLSICNVCVKFHDNYPIHCWDIAFLLRDAV